MTKKARPLKGWGKQTNDSCSTYLTEHLNDKINLLLKKSDKFHIAISRNVPQSIVGVSPFVYAGVNKKYQLPAWAKVTIENIVNAVCYRLNMPKKEVLGRCRKRGYVEARYLAMALARDLEDYSLNSIGKVFGRDHSTVIHGVREYKNWMHMYPEFKGHYDAIYDMFEKFKNSK